MKINIPNKYTWWKNPIKYYKEKKKNEVAKFITEKYFEKTFPNFEQDIADMQRDFLLYGQVITKNGSRVNPETIHEK